MKKADKLNAAQKSRTLVRFESRFEDGFISGYVLGVGPAWFMLLLVDDRVRFNGHQFFRMSNISKLRTDPYEKFVETAMKKRKLRRPKAPRVDLSTTETLLRSTLGKCPLTTIHTEGVDPNVCYIGRIIAIDATTGSMLEIRPGAVWHRKPSSFRLRDITRLNIGGDYEDALYLVGGEPAVC